MYSQNFQSMKSSEFCINPVMVNNEVDIKSKAYINPNILRYPYCLSNINNITFSKRIHINPNFKGANVDSFLSKNRVITELKSKDCLPISGPLLNASVHQNVRKNENLSAKCAGKMQGKYELSGKLSTCNKSKSLQKLLSFENSFSTPGRNSAYFWSKNNTNCAPLKAPVSGSEIGKKNHNEPVELISPLVVPEYTSELQTNMKLKHKAISDFAYNSDMHMIDKEKNCHYKLLNRYKIINVKKPGLKSDIGSEIYSSLEEKNMTPHLKPDFGIIQSKGDCQTKDGELEKHYPAKNLQQLKQNAFKLNKNSYINRIKNLIKTKYMLPNRSLLLKKKEQLLQQQLLKYKLDKRKKYHYGTKRKVNGKPTCESMKLFPKKVAVQTFKVLKSMWKTMHMRQLGVKPLNHLIWRQQQSSDQDSQRTVMPYTNRTVVNIGGIFYKATTNKLTRTKQEHHMLQSVHHFNSECALKGKKHHIVHVRGEKFLLDVSGKTLIRQPSALDIESAPKSTIKRVDIGGVTYIQKSNNVLIQTNSHEARHLVHSAKQRSIVLLHNLHKRSNKPCMIYQRFGVCRRFNKGLCIYIHDPKNIALCKKFLKGECSNSLCPLSHSKIEEKIATCHFFLKGQCNREKCPFLHVKVNKKAIICRNFLQGYCILGQNCTKRHVHQCPDLDEKGICSRGIKCPYPHKISSKRKCSGRYRINELKQKKVEPVGMEIKEDFTADLTSGSNCLTENSGLKKKNASKMNPRVRLRRKKLKRSKEEQVASQEIRNDSVMECIPKRIKLDNLPLFIPLDTK